MGEFNEWLRAILTNNFLDTRRKFVDVQKRAVAREKSLDCLASQLLPTQDPPTSRVAEANEFDRELHLSIQGLDPIDRQILTLRYQQELTFSEIGARAAMNEDAVRKRWGRILVALQQRLRNFDSCASVRKAKSLAAGCP